MPEPGPVEARARGIDQTRRWLDMVEAQIESEFERGLDATEPIAESLPDWTDAGALARYE